MIDDELRRMFTEREVFAPGVDRATSRILTGIPVRRARTRRRQAVAALAVVAAMVAVPVLVDGDGEPRRDALAAAGDTDVTLPVTPKWLPEAAVTRTFADTNLAEGVRAISYEFGGGKGILAVQLHTSTKAPVKDPTAPAATPTEPRVTVRGKAGGEYERINQAQGDQSCQLLWQDAPQLWLSVLVRAEGVTPGVACGAARQVAQGLVDRPMELDRPIRFGLTPRDYVLVQSGTNIEAWCPREVQHAPRCVKAVDAEHILTANGRQVTVRGQIGWLNRTRTEVSLVVPGYVELHTPTPEVDPAVAPLTDDDLIRLAESVSLARGW